MLSSEELGGLAQLLQHGTLPSGLPEGFTVLLLQKGCVVTLEQAATPEAIALLKETSLYAPAEVIRSMACASLQKLALSQLPEAIDGLISRSIEYDQLDLDAWLAENHILPENTSARLLFLLKSRQLDHLLAADPSLEALAAVILDDLPAHRGQIALAWADQNGLRVWQKAFSVLLGGELNQIPAVLHEYQTLNQPDRSRILALLTLGAARNNEPAVTTLCELLIEYDDSQARQIIVDNNIASSDKVTNALTLFLAEQFKQYQDFDFDGSLLRQAYELRAEPVRRRLLRLSRISGLTEWLLEGGRSNRARWTRDLSSKEWRRIIEGLSGAGRWIDLWRLVHHAPPLWGARILQALKKGAWQPADPEDQALFAQGIELAEGCLAAPPEPINRRTFRVPSNSMTAMALNPQGNLLAAGDPTSVLYLWNLASEYPSASKIMLPQAQTRALAFSPDGKYLVAAGGDQQIRVIELAEQKIIKTLGGHHALIRSLCFSPDSRLLASADFSGQCIFWRFPIGQLAETHPIARAEVFAIELADEGSLLLSAGAEKTLDLWRVSGMERLASIPAHDDTITSLAVSGAAIATGARDHRIRMWNLYNRRMTWETDCGPAFPAAIRYSEDMNWLACADTAGNLKFWNITSGESNPGLEHLPAAPVGICQIHGQSEWLAGRSNGAILELQAAILDWVNTPPGGQLSAQKPEIQKIRKDADTSRSNQKWLDWILFLLDWKHRYDIEIGEEHIIHLDEYDIQLEE